MILPAIGSAGGGHHIGSAIWPVLVIFVLMQSVIWGLVALRRHWRIRRMLPWAGALVVLLVLVGISVQFQDAPDGSPPRVIGIVANVLIGVGMLGFGALGVRRRLRIERAAVRQMEERRRAERERRADERSR
jgi:hypothetical protein